MNGSSPNALVGAVDSIFRTVDVVGDAWSWLVMREAVFHGATRFGEFRRRLGAPGSTLSARLRQLSRGGLLAKQRRSSGPVYQLTDSGRDFFGCLMVAMRWGDRWKFPPRSRPLTVMHLGCGNSVDAWLRCAECREVLSAREVSADRAGSSAELVSDARRLRRRTPDLELLERSSACSIARTLTVTGDWWSSLMIREAFFGVRRFDEFQRRLEIAPNILAGRLRRLVDLDVLVKVQYETWPIRHEYRLTEMGLDLYPVPLAMLTWGRRWLEPAAADIRLRHVPCGREVRAILTCAACGEEFSRDDVSLTVAKV